MTVPSLALFIFDLTSQGKPKTTKLLSNFWPCQSLDGSDHLEEAKSTVCYNDDTGIDEAAGKKMHL